MEDSINRMPEEKRDTFIFSLYLEKGGVGKTTSCDELAILSAEVGQKVLCLDLDPQGNLSKLLNSGRELKPFDGENIVKGTYEIFTENARLEDIVRKTSFDVLSENNIDFVPSGTLFRKHDLSKELSEEAGRAKLIYELVWKEVKNSNYDLSAEEVIKKYPVPGRYKTAIINGDYDAIEPILILKNWIEQAIGKYDLVFFDVNPTRNLIADCCLAASDAVIAPSFLEGFSEDCVADLLEQKTAINKKYNDGLQFAGLLLTNVATNTKISYEMCADLWHHFSRPGSSMAPEDAIIGRVIRKDNVVNESNTTGVPLPFLKKKSKACTDYIHAGYLIGLYDEKDCAELLEKHGLLKDNYEFYIDPKEKKRVDEEKAAARKAIDKRVQDSKNKSGKFGINVSAITEGD